MLQLKEFQQHKDVSSSGTNSHRSQQVSPPSVIDHNTTNNKEAHSESKTISENIKQSVSVNQVICANFSFVDVF